MNTLTILTAYNPIFEPKEKVLQHLMSTQSKLSFLNPKINAIGSINGLNDYNRFCIKNLCDQFDTDFVLILQLDSAVINPDMWTERFFEYDYIGAPWKSTYNWIKRRYPDIKDTDDRLVGNGGFSLRSKRLCKYLQDNSEDYEDTYNEDLWICAKLREKLINNGFKIAPYNVAKNFSIERDIYKDSFGAHKWIIDSKTNKRILINETGEIDLRRLSK